MTDADLAAYRQAHQGILPQAGHWIGGHWDYILAGAAVVAGGALAVFGGPAGMVIGGALMNGGLSYIQQKATTGKVDWGQVGVQAAIGGALGGLGPAIGFAGRAGELATSAAARFGTEGAEEVGARFIANSEGDVLDTARVTIPEGKFGYLLKNPSKAGIFRDSMGFDQPGLDTALRSHLETNFGSASRSVEMTGGGTKFDVQGPLTGPSGNVWDIKTVWGVDPDGTIRLITATPP